MSFGSIANYQGASAVEVLSDGDKKFVKVLNSTGSALARGTIGRLSFEYSATYGLIGRFVTGLATQATSNSVICVVCNFPKGKNTIPDGEYGYVQVEGLCDYAITSGTVAANDQLQGIDSGTSLIDQGTNGGVVIDEETCAIAVANVTTNVWQVYLLGRQCVIAAS
jgi:hypothetical protein